MILFQMVMGNRSPRLRHTYDPRDLGRRMRRIQKADRDDMPALWGGDEPDLFDALIASRTAMAEQERERKIDRAKRRLAKAQRSLAACRERAAMEDDRASRATTQERITLHRLRADMRRAQMAVNEQEIRIIEAELQRLDTQTEVALLWV